MNIVITAPRPMPGEVETVNRLFEAGLHVLHLRKPGWGREEVERFTRGVEPRFRERVVVHGHRELAREYGLRGVHLPLKEVMEHGVEDNLQVSVSCHSMEEVRALPRGVAYAFLSPVFDSVSKPGYRGAFEEEELRAFLRETPVPVVALGGVTAENAARCRWMGFDGVAVLGYIWEHPGEAVERFRQLFPGVVLAMGGFDPSAGAGVMADTRAMAASGTYGIGVTTAVTFQNSGEYFGTRWMTREEVGGQIRALAREFTPRYVKVGLVESAEALGAMVREVKAAWPRARVIWDPVLSASAGWKFHGEEERERFIKMLGEFYLVTPNAGEARVLFGKEATPESLVEVCRRTGTNILWKGGHEGEKVKEEMVVDRLVTGRGVVAFAVPRAGSEKHGTGCALSSRVAANLEEGYCLEEACRRGQREVARFIRSNPTRLGVWQGDKHVDLRRVPLQYITDPHSSRSIEEQAEAVCRGGCRWVQFRWKEASKEELVEVGRRVKDICRRQGALFVVNDDVEVALALDADGVHLGLQDADPREARRMLGPGKIIGGTCNTLADIELRCRQGVDYIGLGPFTFTRTKERLAPVLGLEGYRQVLADAREEGIDLPVHAIGGITRADIPALLATGGVTGVALSGLIKNSTDMESETKEILNLIQHASIKDS